MYVAYRSAQGKAVLAAAVLGSGMALLDGTVVNVALRSIGDDLDASLSQLQWVSNGYLLAMASLILLGGALGDRFGRRKVFCVGVVWFAVASLLCGVSLTPEMLIGARLLQGVGAALLTPGSLSMIQGVFAPTDRARAIGTWSGMGSIAAAAGPFLGGALVQYADWRWVFLLNVPVAAATVAVAVRHVPETRDPESVPGFDTAGAMLAATALGATTYALVEAGTGSALVLACAGAGLVAAVAFVAVERRSGHPMMPLGLFSSRQFGAANAMTLLVYAALGGVLFFLVLELQTVSGYGALAAGLSTLPLTVMMLLLAARGGQLATRIGPRLPMTVGPLLCAAGTLLLTAVGPDVVYWRDVLPGMTVFGLGLATLVAPLTATVLAAAPDRRAGIASGVNNAVARTGSLLAVAALPAAVGLAGADYARPEVFDVGYTRALVACAALLAVGGVLSWFTIRDDVLPGEPA